MAAIIFRVLLQRETNTTHGWRYRELPRMPDLLGLCRPPLTRVRDVERPRTLEIQQAETEMGAAPRQSRMQSMRVPPAEEEQNGCWPTDDLVHFLVLRGRILKKVKIEKEEGSLASTKDVEAIDAQTAELHAVRH